MAPATATEPRSLDPASLLWAHRLQRQHAALVSRLRELEATSDDHGTKLSGIDAASGAKLAGLTKRVESCEQNGVGAEAIGKRVEEAVKKALAGVMERMERVEQESESVGCKLREAEERVMGLEGERGRVFEREKAGVKRLGEVEAAVGRMGETVKGLVDEVGDDRFGELEAGVRGLRELARIRDDEVKVVERVARIAVGVAEGLETRLQVLDGKVGDLFEGVEREREYLAMELQRLETRPVTQSSSANIVLAKTPATTAAQAVPASESASMLTARDRPISSDANVAEVMQARMADREATPPLPVRNDRVPQKRENPPESTTGSTHTKVRTAPVRKAAVQPTKERPAVTANQTQFTRKTGHPRKQAIQRQPTALTQEALKDHDSQQVDTKASQADGRKRKAAASVAPSERVTRSARTQATRLTSLDREKYAAPSRKPPMAPRAPLAPRLAQSRVQAQSRRVEAPIAPAPWGRQPTGELSAGMLQAMEQPSKYPVRERIQIEE